MGNNYKWQFKYGKIEELNRDFDISYWQNLGTEAIFDTAWELVVDAWKFKNRDINELRLQRSIANYGKLPS